MNNRDFENLLDPEQTHEFSKIKRQRYNYAIQGLLLGIALAGLWYWFYGYRLPATLRICALASIIIGTCYLYYILMPRDYILNSLSSPQQVQAWVKIYDRYKRNCALGVLLGILVYILLDMGTVIEY